MCYSLKYYVASP